MTPEVPRTSEGYFALSQRPFPTLVFLLPLILVYEICLALVLRSGDGLQTNTVEAHRQLLDFFTRLGIAPGGGLHLGGIVIVVVLLVWQVLSRDRWRVSWSCLVAMAAEAFLLAIPLLLLGSMISHGVTAAAFSGTGAEASASVGPAAARTFGELNLMSQMAISVGAGLYEELGFRMILIAALHTLLVDVGRLPHRIGISVAIVVSAIAFTTYHDLNGPDGTPSASRVIFLLTAGIYFGVLYATRGFGIVVGTHAIYDILTVILTATSPVSETG